MSGVLKCLDEQNSDQIAVRADGITRGLMVANSDHVANHYGYGQKGHIKVTNLAAGQSLSWCMTTGSRFNHIKNLVLSVFGSSARLEILKGANVTVDAGTVVPLVNTNDNSENAAGTVIRATPEYTGGTVWDQAEAYSDSTQIQSSSASVNGNENEELVTKAATKYIFKLTNIGTDPLKNAWIKIFFYEEPKGLI